MSDKFNSLFDQDRTIWVWANQLADVLLVAIIWFVASLPVITVGASSTAAYYVYLKMARHEDGYIFRNFIKSFKQNFIQATVLWLIQLALLAALVFTSYYYYSQEDVVSAGIMAFLMGMILIVLIVCIYLPPIVCRFSNTTMKLLKMAIFMPFKNFLWTLVLILLFAVFTFLGWYIIPFIIIAYGIYAYISSMIFVRIFRPYEKVIRDNNPVSDNNSKGEEDEQTESTDGME